MGRRNERIMANATRVAHHCARRDASAGDRERQRISAKYRVTTSQLNRDGVHGAWLFMLSPILQMAGYIREPSFWPLALIAVTGPEPSPVQALLLLPCLWWPARFASAAYQRRLRGSGTLVGHLCPLGALKGERGPIGGELPDRSAFRTGLRGLLIVRRVFLTERNLGSATGKLFSLALSISNFSLALSSSKRSMYSVSKA